MAHFLGALICFCSLASFWHVFHFFSFFLPRTLFALASILLKVDLLILPLSYCCCARALAFAALPLVSTGYFLSAGSAKSDFGNFPLCLLVNFATVILQVSYHCFEQFSIILNTTKHPITSITNPSSEMPTIMTMIKNSHYRFKAYLTLICTWHSSNIPMLSLFFISSSFIVNFLPFRVCFPASILCNP